MKAFLVVLGCMVTGCYSADRYYIHQERKYTTSLHELVLSFNLGKIPRFQLVMKTQCDEMYLDLYSQILERTMMYTSCPDDGVFWQCLNTMDPDTIFQNDTVPPKDKVLSSGSRLYPLPRVNRIKTLFDIWRYKQQALNLMEGVSSGIRAMYYTNDGNVTLLNGQTVTCTAEAPCTHLLMGLFWISTHYLTLEGSETFVDTLRMLYVYARTCNMSTVVTNDNLNQLIDLYRVIDTPSSAGSAGSRRKRSVDTANKKKKTEDAQPSSNTAEEISQILESYVGAPTLATPPTEPQVVSPPSFRSTVTTPLDTIWNQLPLGYHQNADGSQSLYHLSTNIPQEKLYRKILNEVREEITKDILSTMTKKDVFRARQMARNWTMCEDDIYYDLITTRRYQAIANELKKTGRWDLNGRVYLLWKALQGRDGLENWIVFKRYAGNGIKCTISNALKGLSTIRAKRFIFGISALIISTKNSARIGLLEAAMQKQGDAIIANSRAIVKLQSAALAFQKITNQRFNTHSNWLKALSDGLKQLSDEVTRHVNRIYASLQGLDSRVRMGEVLDSVSQNMMINRLIANTRALNDLARTDMEVARASTIETIFTSLFEGKLSPLAVGPQDMIDLIQSAEIQEYLTEYHLQPVYNTSNIELMYSSMSATGSILTTGSDPDGQLLITVTVPTYSNQIQEPAVHVTPIQQQTLVTSSNHNLTTAISTNHNLPQRYYLISYNIEKKTYKVIPSNDKDCTYYPVISCLFPIISKSLPPIGKTDIECMAIAGYNYLTNGTTAASCVDLWEGTDFMTLMTPTDDGCVFVSSPTTTISVRCGAGLDEDIPVGHTTLVRLCKSPGCYVKAGNTEFVFRTSSPHVYEHTAQMEPANQNRQFDDLEAIVAGAHDHVNSARQRDDIRKKLFMSAINQDTSSSFEGLSRTFLRTVEEAKTSEAMVAKTFQEVIKMNNQRYAEVRSLAQEAESKATASKSLVGLSQGVGLESKETVATLLIVLMVWLVILTLVVVYPYVRKLACYQRFSDRMSHGYNLARVRFGVRPPVKSEVYVPDRSVLNMTDL